MQNYSTSCRAVFGDSNCKLDKYAYSSIYDVINIQNTEVIISGTIQPDGFFTNGVASFEDGILYDIIDHKALNIILSKPPYCDIKKQKRVILTSGCDKNITTCCNKYSNAINFRGEPFIPEHIFK